MEQAEDSAIRLNRRPVPQAAGTDLRSAQERLDRERSLAFGRLQPPLYYAGHSLGPPACLSQPSIGLRCPYFHPERSEAIC